MFRVRTRSEAIGCSGAAELLARARYRIKRELE
jgi:hypothetical protein